MLRSYEPDAEWIDHDGYEYRRWNDRLSYLHVFVRHTGRIRRPIMYVNRADGLPFIKCLLGAMRRQRKWCANRDSISGFQRELWVLGYRLFLVWKQWHLAVHGIWHLQPVPVAMSIGLGLLGIVLGHRLHGFHRKPNWCDQRDLGLHRYRLFHLRQQRFVAILGKRFLRCRAHRLPCRR